MNKLENAITELDAILLDLQNLRKAKAGDVGRAQGRALAARAVIVNAARGAHWRRWDELTLEEQDLVVQQRVPLTPGSTFDTYHYAFIDGIVVRAYWSTEKNRFIHP